MSGAACTRTGSSVASDSRLLTIVHTEYGMCLTTMEFAAWREVQDAFSGYKASLGPWSVTEILEYLPIEYPTEQPFTAEAVRALAASEDATQWAKQLTEDERTSVPANVRAVAAAAARAFTPRRMLAGRRSRSGVDVRNGFQDFRRCLSDAGEGSKIHSDEADLGIAAEFTLELRDSRFGLLS